MKKIEEILQGLAKNTFQKLGIKEIYISQEDIDTAVNEYNVNIKTIFADDGIAIKGYQISVVKV